MKRVFVWAAFFTILAFTSCSKEKITGSGPVITETRNLSGFNSVSAAGSTNIFVTQGANFNVEIKGYSNLLPYYETLVTNNTLRLGFKPGVNVKNDNLEVYVTLPSLNSLSLAGSGDIRTSGTFSGNTNFKASIAGSGSIFFSDGTAQQFNSTIAGSGNIYALGMAAQKADVNIDGSGNTEISAAIELKVRISGSGNVYYRGTPVISTQISGSGSVLPR